jgi:hypothetical protein
MAISAENHTVAERLGDWVRLVDADGNFAGWFRDRVMTGDFKPRWDFGGHTGEPFQAVLTVELPELPGWEARFVYEFREGAIRLVRQEAILLDESAGPGALYRKFGGRKLEQQVREEFQQPFIRMLLPAEWQGDLLERRRAGRHPVTDLELAELGERYERARDEQPHRPMALLAEREGKSRDTLQGQFREAVARGLWTPRSRGKPSGDLTNRARALLTARDEARKNEGKV